MASSMKAPIHLGPDFFKNSAIYKNTRFENIENVFNIIQKFIQEHSEELFITIMDEINTGQRIGDQVGEGKSLCPRRFRSVCWSDGTRTVSRRRKVERPN